MFTQGGHWGAGIKNDGWRGPGAAAAGPEVGRQQISQLLPAFLLLVFPALN